MQLKIERMNHTGEGIAINNNKVFFIPKTIPQDIIKVDEENMIKHKNYNQVIKYDLLEPSPNRVTIPCPYYEKCGGCQLMELSYENKCNNKEEKVKNIINKYTKLTINPKISPTTPYQYRNKITLQVKEGILGLYSQNTNNIIPIKKCLLIPDQLNSLIPVLSKKIDLSNVKQIVLRIMQNQIMVQIIGNTNLEKLINSLSHKVSSIYINEVLIYGIPYLTELIPPYQFRVSPNSFFQTNHEATIILYNKIKEYLGTNNNNILDLYCGTASIGIYISKNSKQIIGIEINKSSTKDAKKNIKLNKLNNITILNGDVKNLLKNDNYYDAIIVDPPRSGLDSKTKEILLDIKSPKIIYISCNPITLARDINTLKQLYNLEKIELVDMFPNTYHCESVCILERRKV